MEAAPSAREVEDELFSFLKDGVLTMYSRLLLEARAVSAENAALRAKLAGAGIAVPAPPPPPPLSLQLEHNGSENPSGAAAEEASAPPRTAAAAGLDSPKGSRTRSSQRQSQRRSGGSDFASVLNLDHVAQGDVILMWPEWQVDGEEQQDSPTSRAFFDTKCLDVAITGVLSEPSSRSRLIDRCALPFHPGSKFKFCWDVAAVTAVMFDLVTIPLQVFQWGRNTPFQALQMLVLIFWTVDMFVSSQTAYYNRQGHLVVSKRSALRNYLRTWFVPDTLMVGIDWIIVLTTMADGAAMRGTSYARISKFIRFVRVVRSFRLFRAMRLREILNRLHEHVDSEYTSIITNVVVNMLTLLLISHFLACLFFWVGLNDADNSWIEEYGVANLRPGEQYMVSLHWSLAQLTPAPMPVMPQNFLERLYTVIVVLLGIVFFSTFLSTVTAGMTRLRNLKSQETVDTFKMRQFLKVHKISSDLSARVLRYIDISRKAHRKKIPESEVAHLSFLSGPLSIELQKEIYGPYLETHAFFAQYKECSSTALSHLCATLYMFGTSQRDSVFTAGNAATCCYHVVSGALIYKGSLVYAQRKSMKRVTHGAWICEAVLWVQWINRGDFISLTECDLVSINSARFREVTCTHHNVALIAREYAQNYLKKMEDMLAAEEPIDDLDMDADGDEMAVQKKASTGGWLWDQNEDDTGNKELVHADMVEASLLEAPGLKATGSGSPEAGPTSSSPSEREARRERRAPTLSRVIGDGDRLSPTSSADPRSKPATLDALPPLQAMHSLKSIHEVHRMLSKPATLHDPPPVSAAPLRRRGVEPESL